MSAGKFHANRGPVEYGRIQYGGGRLTALFSLLCCYSTSLVSVVGSAGFSLSMFAPPPISSADLIWVGTKDRAEAVGWMLKTRADAIVGRLTTTHAVLRGT
jgi:hypothetical protein